MKKNHYALLFALLFVGSGVIFAYWLIASRDADLAGSPMAVTGLIRKPSVAEPPFNPLADTDGDGLTDGDEVELYKTDPGRTDTDGDTYSDKMELDLGFDPLIAASSTLAIKIVNVDWIDWRTPVNMTDIFGADDNFAKLYPQAVDKTGRQIILNEESLKLPIADFYEQAKIFYLGTVRDGEYAGDKLYDLEYPCDGMCNSNSLRLIKHGEQLVALTRYSSIGQDDNNAEYIAQLTWLKIFTLRNDIYLNNHETPQIIRLASSKLLLHKGAVTHLSAADSVAEKLLEYAPNQALYQSNGCFIAKAADGSIRDYRLDLPMRDDNSAENDLSPHVLKITFNDGSVNKAEYLYHTSKGGCGVSCYYYPEVQPADLVETGKFAGGDAVYELKATASSTLLDDLYKNSYAAQREDGKKISKATFLKDHPIVFWKDPFGHLMAFSNIVYESAAECGKPVIYLYPEKSMAVSVKVAPNGGFKFTEPAYGSGWQVTASPKSELLAADGKVYPYLFWEGYAYDYSAPHEGFVIARADVPRFLARVLPLLGLNAQETADFTAFWEPRMRDYPYYLVSFVPQADFEKVAPLSVEPKPDTTIRVFMDYSGLSRPIFAKQPRIVTPERRGFTVVEWGGRMQ